MGLVGFHCGGLSSPASCVLRPVVTESALYDVMIRAPLESWSDLCVVFSKWKLPVKGTDVVLSLSYRA